MNAGIEAVSALGLADMDLPVSNAQPVAARATGFGQMIERELGQINANAAAAESAMRGLASGKPVELHEVMISLEKARLSVQTFVQVRNKLVESYQDLMRMQM